VFWILHIYNIPVCALHISDLTRLIKTEVWIIRGCEGQAKRKGNEEDTRLVRGGVGKGGGVIPPLRTFYGSQKITKITHPPLTKHLVTSIYIVSMCSLLVWTTQYTTIDINIKLQCSDKNWSVGVELSNEISSTKIYPSQD